MKIFKLEYLGGVIIVSTKDIFEAKNLMIETLLKSGVSEKDFIARDVKEININEKSIIFLSTEK